MQSNDVEELQQIPHYIPGPPQLPTLVKGQKLKSGPYVIRVTDEMVAEREKQNLELYKAWMREQRMRNMLPEEDADEYIGDFKQVLIRRNFVRKVFCILALQLTFTICVTAIFMFVDAARKFMILHWYLWIVALLLFIITYCAISCSVQARRTPPYNYICLCLMTLAKSYLVATVSVIYSFELILIALGMTVVVITIVAFVATFSKFDLTMRPGLMMIFGLVAIVAIITMTLILMFTYITILHLLVAIVGTFILCMYLYFDVQTIMGGRRVELEPDEVIFAATQIYVDIILLYRYILMCLGVIHRT